VVDELNFSMAVRAAFRACNSSDRSFKNEAFDAQRRRLVTIPIKPDMEV
jgi:hypothetical protein